jgi:hypothetical protein
MKKSLIPFFAAVALLAGCDNDPAGPGDDSFMTASISGATQVDYLGTAEFHVGNPPSGGERFQIVSVGRGGLANQGFAITRWDGGRLAVGTYPIALVDLATYLQGGAPPQGITLQYGRTRGAANPLTFNSESAPVEELFVADGGQLTITVSTPERIEGRFSVSGFRYCPAPGNAPGCALPSSPLQGAPRLTVEASFAARPLDISVWPMPDRM